MPYSLIISPEEQEYLKRFYGKMFSIAEEAGINVREISYFELDYPIYILQYEGSYTSEQLELFINNLRDSGFSGNYALHITTLATTTEQILEELNSHGIDVTASVGVGLQITLADGRINFAGGSFRGHDMSVDVESLELIFPGEVAMQYERQPEFTVVSEESAVGPPGGTPAGELGDAMAESGTPPEGAGAQVGVVRGLVPSPGAYGDPAGGGAVGGVEVRRGLVRPPEAAGDREEVRVVRGLVRPSEYADGPPVGAAGGRAIEVQSLVDMMAGTPPRNASLGEEGAVDIPGTPGDETVTPAGELGDAMAESGTPPEDAGAQEEDGEGSRVVFSPGAYGEPAGGGAVGGVEVQSLVDMMGGSPPRNASLSGSPKNLTICMSPDDGHSTDLSSLDRLSNFESEDSPVLRGNCDNSSHAEGGGSGSTY